MAKREAKTPKKTAKKAAPEPAQADLAGDIPAEESAPAAASTSGESWQGLARKYRPQVFADLIGQEGVARNLGSAIEQGRVSHAHLMAGPRGVGKTTSARILAKALNCERGPTPTPCGVCRHCREIAGGNHLDVLEIDAASNTQVDKMRDLLEGVTRAPFSARYKVYIIDEVHMLSTGSFNALLKTLEEPPPHVVFIFATTELEKIPETIRSRCIVHTFRRVTTDDIIRRLDQIARAEGIDLPKEQSREIFQMIANAVEGGMRDAVVALDQLIAATAGKPTAEAAQQLLGLSSRSVLAETVSAIATKDAAALLRIVEQLVAQGRSMERFVKSLLAYLHDVMMLQAVDNADFVSLSGEEYDKARALAHELPRTTVFNIMNQLFELEERLKRSTQARFLVEFTFLRLISVEPIVPIDDIMKRLHALPDVTTGSPEFPKSSANKSGSGSEEPSRVGKGRGAISSMASPRASSSGASSAYAFSSASPSAAFGASNSPGPAAQSAPAAQSGSRAASGFSTQAPAPRGASAIAAEPEDAAPDSPAPRYASTAPAVATMNEPEDGAARAGASSSAAASSVASPSSAAATSASPALSPDLEKLDTSEIIEWVTSQLPQSFDYLGRYLRHAVALRLRGRSLEIELQATDKITANTLDRPDNRSALESTLAQLTGVEVSLKLLRTSASATPGSSRSGAAMSGPAGSAASSAAISPDDRGSRGPVPLSFGGPTSSAPVVREAPPANSPRPASSGRAAFNEPAPVDLAEPADLDSEEEPADLTAHFGAPIVEQLPPHLAAARRREQAGASRDGSRGFAERYAITEDSTRKLLEDSDFGRRARMVRDFFEGSFIDSNNRPLQI